MGKAQQLLAGLQATGDESRQLQAAIEMCQVKLLVYILVLNFVHRFVCFQCFTCSCLLWEMRTLWGVSLYARYHMILKSYSRFFFNEVSAR